MPNRVRATRSYSVVGPRYGLCFLSFPSDLKATVPSARHGEGFHNAAEAKYGTEAWENKWSKLDGDDDGLVWGPDAELTPHGEDQIAAVGKRWEKQLDAGAPLPEVFLSSGLTRALQTWEITFGKILEGRKGGERVLEVREVSILSVAPWRASSDTLHRQGIREHNGVHTCDKRRTKV